jgi:hypothetical protein
MAEPADTPSAARAGTDAPAGPPPDRAPPSGRLTAAERAVTAVTVGLLLLVTFPVYGLANSTEPIVLGMPWSMFWLVAWIAVEFVVVLAIYRREHQKGGR